MYISRFMDGLRGGVRGHDDEVLENVQSDSVRSI